MHYLQFKSFKLIVTAALAAAVTLTSCNRGDDNDTSDPVKPFDITEHFVAGTITQKTGSKYSSVFFIQFLEDNRALFINSGANNLVGNYKLTQDSLIFKVEGGNARTAKFALDKDHKITSSYYTAHTSLQYDTKGELLASVSGNDLAGKTFKGEEFKMGDVSNRQVIYSFNKTGATTYGSGTDAAAIDNTAGNYTLIGGKGFKAINGSTTELGYLSGKTLTVFKVSGLYYYGKYDQQ